MSGTPGPAYIEFPSHVILEELPAGLLPAFRSELVWPYLGRSVLIALILIPATSAIGMSLAIEARKFLRSTHSGLLSTLSTRFEGYPYGSVAPFVLDHDGQPLILISTLADHTKNIIEHCKVSLLVFAGAEDLHANARLTLLGDAEQTDGEPKVFKDIMMTFTVKAAEDARDKIKKAIELSLEKYCGVAAMLQKHSKINYELILKPE